MKLFLTLVSHIKVILSPMKRTLLSAVEYCTLANLRPALACLRTHSQQRNNNVLRSTIPRSGSVNKTQPTKQPLPYGTHWYLGSLDPTIATHTLSRVVRDRATTPTLYSLLSPVASRSRKPVASVKKTGRPHQLLKCSQASLKLGELSSARRAPSFRSLLG